MEVYCPTSVDYQHWLGLMWDYIYPPLAWTFRSVYGLTSFNIRPIFGLAYLVVVDMDIKN